MVLRWHVQKVSKKEEFLYQLSEPILIMQLATPTYGRMGIKVWIMKGEVYGKRSFSTLLEWTKKQAGKGGDSLVEIFK
jgi:hypothetical protein